MVCDQPASQDLHGVVEHAERCGYCLCWHVKGWGVVILPPPPLLWLPAIEAHHCRSQPCPPASCASCHTGLSPATTCLTTHLPQTLA